MDIDYKAIGRRIKIARIRKDLTQDNVAEMIGLSTPHMSNVETGSTKVSLPTIIAIANALSVSVDELLCDTVIRSKEIFEGEINRLLTDCSEYEIRILADILKTSKTALRNNDWLKNK